MRKCRQNEWPSMIAIDNVYSNKEIIIASVSIIIEHPFQIGGCLLLRNNWKEQQELEVEKKQRQQQLKYST